MRIFIYLSNMPGLRLDNISGFFKQLMLVLVNRLAEFGYWRSLACLLLAYRA